LLSVLFFFLHHWHGGQVVDRSAVEEYCGHPLKEKHRRNKEKINTIKDDED